MYIGLFCSEVDQSIGGWELPNVQLMGAYSFFDFVLDLVLDCHHLHDPD
jgi:hypothetical protein